MDARIDEACYEEMISSLRIFRSEITMAVSGLHAVVSNCVSHLTEEDNAVRPICEALLMAEAYYLNAAEEASAIASAMEEELEAQRREDAVMNGDGEE